MTDKERRTLLLRGWTEVRGLSGDQMRTQCCRARSWFFRRRGTNLQLRCGECGTVELMQAFTFNTGWDEAQ
jgi:hypothetical protein